MKLAIIRVRYRITLLCLLAMLMLATGLRTARTEAIDDTVLLRRALSKPPAQRVHSFATQQQRALLATSRGLLAYDGNQWQQLIDEETFAVAAMEGTRLVAGTRSGVLVSDDNGKNWRITNQGLATDALPLAIKPAQQQRVYIGTDHHGIYRSDDGMNSWQTMGHGLPTSIGAAAFAAIKRIAVDPNNSDLVFAATDARGVYWSRDGGENWQPAALNLSGPFHHRVNAPFITFDELLPQHIYTLVNFPVHSHRLDHSIHLSTDGGEHWTLVRKLDPNQIIQDFRVSGGIATIETPEKGYTVNLNESPAPEDTEIAPSAAPTIPGTDPDFTIDNFAVLHDDGMLFSFRDNDLTDLGQLVARRFYQRHSDNYDLIITFADPFYVGSTAGVAFAYNAPVVSQILGIGITPGAYNGGPFAYGSQGRLRGFCNMNNISRYPEDPQQAFQGTNSPLDILSHEVGHVWSAFFHFDDAGFTSDELLGRALAHWSFFYNSQSSVLEGNMYQDMGNGLFRTTGATSRYNELEQYAMGIRSTATPNFFINNPTKIDPPLIIGGQVVDPTQPGARALPPIAPPELPAVTVTGTRQDVSFQQILKAEGPRNPPPSPDQGRITAAFVYLVPPGREPMASAFDRAKRLRSAFLDFFSKISMGANIDGTVKPGGGSDTTPPKLTITSPNGGESFLAGNKFNISWDSSDENGIAKHDIFLSLDGGASFPITVASKINGKTKNIEVLLPVETFSDKAIIKIVAVDYAGNQITDTSNANFVLQRETVAPVVKVTKPNGGERIVAGLTYEITWVSTDDGQLQSHDINLSIDGGQSFGTSITSGIPGRVQSFIWRVPADLKADMARIQVVTKDSAGNAGRDGSDGSFVVVAADKNPPVVRLLKPVGGESLQAGENTTISWTTNDDGMITGHELSLSTDGGKNFDLPIANGLSGSAQSFLWRVPDQELPNARIRIVAIDEQNNRGIDASRSDVLITKRDVTAPTVQVISPKGGEVVRSGEQLTISWQTTDNVSVRSQRIALSLDGGQTFPTTVASELGPTVASFNFTIPETLQSTSARIEVSAVDTSGLTGRGVSAANFTIESKDTQAPLVTILSPNGGEVTANTDRLRVSWRSNDNVGVVAHDVQISTNGGTNFTTVQSGLAGTVQEVLLDVNTLISERVKVKIVARDARNNTGSDESDNLFAIALKPGITNAKYNNGSNKLTIFATGVSSATTVEINGQAITAIKIKFNAQKKTLVLKANRSQLNLRAGENNIVVKERGLISAAFKLML
ncbi:MAG: Ig-like domain-containing protein [Acidobacteriota bacterium]